MPRPRSADILLAVNAQPHLKGLRGGRGRAPREPQPRRRDVRPLALLVLMIALIGLSVAVPARAPQTRPGRTVFPLPRLGEFAGDVLQAAAAPARP